MIFTKIVKEIMSTQTVLTVIFVMLTLGISTGINENPILYGLKFIALISGIVFLSLKSVQLPRAQIPAIVSVIFGFVAVMAISTFVAGDYTDTGLLNLLIYILLFFFVLLYSAEDGKAVFYLYNAIKTCLTIFIVVSFFLIFSDIGYSTSGRFQGSYYNPNGTGSSACVLFVICVIDYITHRNKKDLVILLMSLTVLALSQSRTSLATAAVCIFIFLFLEKKIKMLAVYCSLVVVFILGYVATLSLVDGLHVRDMTEMSGRENYLQTYFEIFSDNPIIGAGLCNRFKTEIAYFDIISSSGFLGLFLFVGAIGLSLVKGFIYSKYIYDLKTLAYICLCVVLLSVGDGYISNIANPLSIFFWLYLGVVSKINKRTLSYWGFVNTQVNSKI